MQKNHGIQPLTPQEFFRIPMLFLFGSLTLSLAGCATMKRWSCNGNNWYEVGYQAAMRGERLDGDQQFRSCKDVEGGMDYAAADRGFKVGMNKYCSEQTAFDNGKSGAPMNFEFCEHSKSLQNAYNKGIKAYCEPQNALAVGRSGQTYRDICPNEMKATFVAQYREGRRQYLLTTIESQKRQMEDLNYRITILEEKRQSLGYQVQLLPHGIERTREKVYDPIRKTYIDKESITEDPVTAQKRKQLTTELERINQEITQSHERQQSLRQSIRNMEDEIKTI